MQPLAIRTMSSALIIAPLVIEVPLPHHIVKTPSLFTNQAIGICCYNILALGGWPW